MKLIARLQCYLLLPCLILVETNFGQVMPAGFSAVAIGSNWNQPVGTAFTKDGHKLFAWEKGGRVYICQWNNDTKQYVKQLTPVLDISSEVGDYRDHGLLGFALDPQYDNNGWIYLFYIVDRNYLINFGTSTYNPADNDKPGATIGRITRYKTMQNTAGEIIADSTSRFILLGETKSSGVPITYLSHGVGSLAFASDGTLLASEGDGGSYSSVDTGNAKESFYAQALADGILRPQENVGAFRAQMINSLNGKLLRLDPSTGNGVPGNPFYSAIDPRAAYSRVWALGFRNPFRFTVRPNTGSPDPAAADIGEIYVGDVGYNTYEEMDIVTKPGSNFGWPLFEGQTATTTYGKRFIANRDEPNPLYGIDSCSPYFNFNDLIKQPSADGNQQVFNPCDSAIPILSNTPNRYIHNRPALDWKHNGNITRVGIFNGNAASEAQIGSPESGITGGPFAGTCSIGGVWCTSTTFPVDFQNTYLFADYGTKFIRKATFQSSTLQKVDTFMRGFSAIVSLTQSPLDSSLVFVDLGLDNPIQKVNYGGPLPPVAIIKSDKLYGPSPLNIQFTGHNSYDPEHAALSYQWDFGDGTLGNDADLAHTYNAAPGTPGKYMVKLTVKDNLNLIATDSIVVSVNNTPPLVNILSPVKNSKYLTGTDTAYSLLANVSDLESIALQLTYQWRTIYYHNNVPSEIRIDTAQACSTIINRVGCNGENDYWRVVLTVTDPGGLSTSDSSAIYPLCPGDILLPPGLVDFSVKQVESFNELQWETQGEANVKSYLVEKSRNGKDFLPLGDENANNLSGLQQYTFTDKQYIQGMTYYRLRTIMLDGSFTESKIIRIYNGSPADERLIIWPNPVSKELIVSTSFAENGPVTLSIRNINGQLLKKENRIIEKGYVSLVVNGIDQLAPGTYLLEIRQNEHSRFAKFIKVN